MKIAIVGAMSVGKTTLANELLKHFNDYKLLPEAARLAAELGFNLDKNVTIETEIWLAAKQYEMEVTNGNNWIADRSFIDLLAYIHLLFPNQKWLRETVGELLKRTRYDLVIYLPSGEFPIEDDGLRSLDHEFQRNIDREIVSVMDSYRIPSHKVTGSREERFAYVKTILDQIE